MCWLLCAQCFTGSMWPRIAAGGVPTFRRFRNWPTCHSVRGSAGDSNRTKTRGEWRTGRDGTNCLTKWRRTGPLPCHILLLLLPLAASLIRRLSHPSTSINSHAEDLKYCSFGFKRMLFRVKCIHNWPGDLVWATPFSVFVSPADFTRGTPPRRRVTTQTVQLLVCCV